MKMTITSREAYMIATALYREVKHQQSLPSEQQEWTMTEDMKTLLQRNFSPYTNLLAAIDRAAGRAPIDLAEPKRCAAQVPPRRQGARTRGTPRHCH
jgi:hypothetical protein